MNKKVALSILCVIVQIVPSYAQNEQPYARLKVGMKAGFNISSVSDKQGPTFDVTSKKGIVSGVFVVIPLRERLRLQPELLLSQKGFKASGNLMGFNYTFSRITTYLDLPLLLHWNLWRGIAVVAGPQYGYLILQKDEREFGHNEEVLDFEFSQEQMRKGTLGMTAGLELAWDPMVLSCRAGIDFQNNITTNTTPQYKNRWLQFALGLNF
jgi:hypothetical protein